MEWTQSSAWWGNIKQTVPVPGTKWVKRYVDMPKADSGKQKQAGVDDDRFMQQQQQLAVVEPQAALPNQRAVWASVDKLLELLR